ncbi:hypothetical protein KUTeg_005653 [Tegillarca granosa]|uniref:Integrase core domain-containing protein n=1 Tax=Tegillarca granosa TaxID=220873 RepID=A0ABQ9FKF4_TEGGR|nr:hypothetical protein KUTeg_004839 [Tegillarca granosa]KAJ8317749.1 hypothetical protein KUTeg_005653 [Tegillarca granosa]
MADQRNIKNIDSLIYLYFNFGLIYDDIAFVLAENHGIEISTRHLKRRLSHLEDVVDFIKEEVKGPGLLHGYRIMFEKCRDRGLQVKKETVRFIMKEIDPEGVEIRASKRLVRRAYFAKGPNYIWHIDGYDKLKPFGLCISGSIDGFSRSIIWLNVYNTNNNPRIIGGYFLESVKQIRGSPCIVRGDCGTENGHVRDFQTFFHRNSSFGNVYMSGASTCNQRIESWWGFLSRECTQFWIELFCSMEEEGLYN